MGIMVDDMKGSRTSFGLPPRSERVICGDIREGDSGMPEGTRE